MNWYFENPSSNGIMVKNMPIDVKVLNVWKQSKTLGVNLLHSRSISLLVSLLPSYSRSFDNVGCWVCAFLREDIPNAFQRP